LNEGVDRPPELHASLVRDTADHELPISKTLINHVLKDRHAILTHNAQDDSRFEASASIISHNIREAMCAPLIGRYGVAGAIYVDSGPAESTFTDADLELLTSIGRVVGVAVENARLYKENIERERLAAIGRATAGLGHCVKNILTGLKAGGEFMDLALESDHIDWVRKGWPMVRRAAERIEDLMLDLLTYSRERPPHFQCIDINDLCAEALEVVARRAEQGNTEVELKKAEMSQAYLDGREIYRLVLNLLTNAVDACEDKSGGRVVLETRSNARGCYIIVKDNGCGIPQDIQDNLFQAFVSTKGSGGTGLGLACCEKIVREHGGEITFETEVGLGTTFRVFLPHQTIAQAE